MSTLINLQSNTQINVYVDESGDEGFNFTKPRCQCSKEWLMFTAVCVKETDESHCLGVIDTIIKRGWLDCNNKPPEWHWHKLGHSHKLMIAQELANQPITVISVGMWKPKLWGQVGWNNEKLWYYTSQFLLERISWHAYSMNATAKVTFSLRRKTYNEYMKSRVESLMKSASGSIKPVFVENSLQFLPNNRLKLLQIADMYAGITANAIEPDHFGNYEPRYLKQVSHQLYSKHGKVFSYGLKLYPDRDVTKALLDKYSFLLSVEEKGSRDLRNSA